MAITWQTRGEGRFAHRFHRLTAEQAAAAVVPDATGVHELTVDGDVAFGVASHTNRQFRRPLLWGPVVYATLEEAETHGEIWLTRDRDAFYNAIEAGG